MSEQDKPQIVSIFENPPEPQKSPAKEVAPEVRETISAALGKDVVDIVQLPKKPVSSLKQAAFSGAAGFGLGAIIHTALHPALNLVLKKKQRFNAGDMLDFAAIMAGASTVMGWYTGKSQAKEYDLKVDNIKLQHKIDRLEAKKTEAPQSFVKDVTASKEAADSPQISR